MEAALEEESVFEDIEKLSRDLASAKDGTPSILDLVQALSKLQESLTTFRQHVLALYDAGELLTSRYMSTSVAAAAWEGLHNNYSAVLNRFIRLPKIVPAIDDVCEVLRDLEAKSDQEYRSYKETEHLLGSPENAQELNESIKDAKEGKLETFATAEDFKRSLRR
jgi:hypothetical protein